MSFFSIKLAPMTSQQAWRMSDRGREKIPINYDFRVSLCMLDIEQKISLKLATCQ